MVLVVNENAARRLPSINVGMYAVKEDEVPGATDTYTVFEDGRCLRGVILAENEVAEASFDEARTVILPPEAKMLPPAQPSDPLTFDLRPIEGFDDKVFRVEPNGYVQSRTHFEEEYKAFIASLGHDVSVPALYR